MIRAERIRRARTEAHMSIAEVAQRSGHSQEIVRYCERGKVVPGDEVLWDILDAIDMGPSVLLARHRDHLRAVLADLDIYEVYVFGEVLAGTDTGSCALELLVRLPPGFTCSDLDHITCQVEDAVGVEAVVLSRVSLDDSLELDRRIGSEAQPLATVARGVR